MSATAAAAATAGGYTSPASITLLLSETLACFYFFWPQTTVDQFSAEWRMNLGTFAQAGIASVNKSKHTHVKGRVACL